MKEYRPKVVPRKLDKHELKKLKQVASPLELAGIELDELLFYDDYEFPVEDEPSALSSMAICKKCQVKLNIVHPEIILFKTGKRGKKCRYLILFQFSGFNFNV